MAGFISGLQIGPKLGNGHFGEVFKGQDPAHGEVAVKILRRESYHDDETWPQFKAAYLAEAQNLSRASHRNVVQVHHVVESQDGSSVIICMAYCPGGSLQAPFEKGPMTLPAVRKVGTSVLMGLGAMHTRGMIHRDIKPANILMDARAEVQISDFGFVTDALVLGYASQAGYADHIAHEVWNGKGTSAKSDIWALGMTLYRLLHGKVWYDAAPSPQHIIKHGGFADTLRWLPHIPKPWRRVLRTMLNDDDGARFQNAAQALAGLARLAVSPVWVPGVSPDLVRWEQTKGPRRVIVEWTILSPRKHKWVAWSESTDGTGRTKKLAGSVGTVGRSQVLHELDAYFSV